MAVRITCINKSSGNHENKHESIEFFGWLEEQTGKSGKCTRAEMVKYLDDKNQAYVKDMYGNTAYCYVRKSTIGNRFVQTYSDNRYSDNLLQLFECK